MIIGWDTETDLFRPGVMAPELACVTWQTPGRDAEIVHHTEASPLLASWLSSGAILVGHNVAYDFAVIGAAFPELLPSIFAAYDADRVTDTMLRQKLLDIAAGCYRGRFGDDNKWIKHDYSLLALTKRHTGRLLEKDEWRMKYGTMRHLPLSAWPQGARTYPLEDARATLDVYLAQEKHAAYLQDQFRQSRASFWLHLASAWGLRTREAKVKELEKETLWALEEVKENLIAAGLVRRDGSRDTKAAKQYMEAVCQREGLKVRLMATGETSLDSDACKATEDALLGDYAELSTLGATLSKDVPALLSGATFPIHTRFDLAETGRTTSSSPNVQNWRRLPGIRESFIPRPGRVFAQADYDGLELRTLAQCCMSILGNSELAKALNAGRDPHLELAAHILGTSYEDAQARKEDKDVDDARQTAKVANFGFPGGLGITKLCLFARKTYKVELSETRAKELKAAWLERWPEMRAYFDFVNGLCAQGGPDKLATVEHLFTRRMRGGATYTAACNSHFQGLGADATKHAGWLVSKACYTEPASALFGSRIVNYVHDEFILETDEGPGAAKAAAELARLMIAGANVYLPDVPAKTKPLLMRFWSKKAKAVYDDAGRLVPWGDLAA